MSELLSVATPGQDSDSAISQQPSEPIEEPLFCDAGTQVIPERKNARIQTTTKTKTCGTYQDAWVQFY